MKTSTATRLLALTASLAFALSARAQLAPAPSATLAAPPSEKDKEVVKLNVFQVVADNDDEYRAANTRSRVATGILGARRSASDTVITETPAACATCFIEG